MRAGEGWGRGHHRGGREAAGPGQDARVETRLGECKGGHRTHEAPGTSRPLPPVPARGLGPGSRRPDLRVASLSLWILSPRQCSS